VGEPRRWDEAEPVLRGVLVVAVLVWALLFAGAWAAEVYVRLH